MRRSLGPGHGYGPAMGGAFQPNPPFSFPPPPAAHAPRYDAAGRCGTASIPHGLHAARSARPWPDPGRSNPVGLHATPTQLCPLFYRPSLSTSRAPVDEPSACIASFGLLEFTLHLRSADDASLTTVEMLANGLREECGQMHERWAVNGLRAQGSPAPMGALQVRVQPRCSAPRKRQKKMAGLQPQFSPGNFCPILRLPHTPASAPSRKKNGGRVQWVGKFASEPLAAWKFLQRLFFRQSASAQCPSFFSPLPHPPVTPHKAPPPTSPFRR
ncbi:hypothetical protein L1887_53040 [Cichorium endivia]|nr:hypothetical protein L1887_53040 [Cichorium endivia]